jgi:hypothetical protein
MGALNIPDPETPVGARGCGEPPVGGGCAAILNALSDALGRQHLPARAGECGHDSDVAMKRASDADPFAGPHLDAGCETERVMAVIRDVMPAFDLLQPDSAAEAQKLLEQHGEDAWVMAGGLDSFDWLKDRIKKPKVLVDLSGVEELKGIRATSDGVEIGAMTTLTEIANHPAIRRTTACWRRPWNWWLRRRFATRERWAATCRRMSRCWYYRGGWPCYRAGGNICYADTPVGRNREHAIFGADRCVAVHPSDSAPALIVLDAKFVVQTPKGERRWMRKIILSGPEMTLRGSTF